MTDEGRWSTPRLERFTPGKIPVPTAEEAGVAPLLHLDGCGKARPTRIRLQSVASRYMNYAVTDPAR
jgi:hypothetical protein